jgi:hypothetical protein
MVFLRIEMPDGSPWEVDAEVVADNRAHYYDR